MVDLRRQMVARCRDEFDVFVCRYWASPICHVTFKNCDEFIACGREGLPLEMQNQSVAAGTSRRRAPTPYHAPALQGINNTPYNRLKKGSKIETCENYRLTEHHVQSL